MNLRILSILHWSQVPSPIGGGSPTSSVGGGGLFYTRDHGLRTPPAPPCTVPQTTIETIPSVDEFQACTIVVS